MITKEESLNRQARAHPYMKPEITEQMTLVVPGRRSLGESWTKVVIGHDADDVVIDASPTEAPADRRPMMAVAGADAEYTKYILEAMQEKAAARAAKPSDLTREEQFKAINEAWHTFLGEKMAFLRGRSSFGAAGGIQRQKVTQNPSTRPAHMKG